MPSKRSIENRIEKLENALGYGEDTAGDLYLKALINANSPEDKYPGAEEEYMRRLREANRFKEAFEFHQRRRSEGEGKAEAAEESSG